MFIWKAMVVPEKKTIAAWFLFIGLIFLMIPSYTYACSCVWKGPFLTASKDAPLVVIGKIIFYGCAFPVGMGGYERGTVGRS